MKLMKQFVSWRLLSNVLDYINIYGIIFLESKFHRLGTYHSDARIDISTSEGFDFSHPEIVFTGR